MVAIRKYDLLSPWWLIINIDDDNPAEYLAEVVPGSNHRSASKAWTQFIRNRCRINKDFPPDPGKPRQAMIRKLRKLGFRAVKVVINPCRNV